MKQAFILHGVCDEHEYFEMDFPSPSNAHWLPWLQQKFLRAGVLCQALEMPKPYAPVYDEWATVFEQMTWGDDTIIVGHSSGCGFIVKWLLAHPERRLAKLVMVAPYLDPYRKRGDFLQCTLQTELADRITEMHILYSMDEPVKGVAETVDLMMQHYPKTVLHQFTDKEHFCYSDVGAQFQELWNIAQPRLLL